MLLLEYSPRPCVTGDFINCKELVAYVRLNVQQQTEETAMLQFFTTIFTCIILTAGSLLFQNDTQKIVIIPITKMVGIIKSLADDPLQKPEPPQFDEAESQIAASSN